MIGKYSNQKFKQSKDTQDLKSLVSKQLRVCMIHVGKERESKVQTI